MSEHTRHDAERVDAVDRRERDVDAAAVDERVERRDADMEYTENRPAEPRGESAAASTADRDTYRDPTSERRPSAGPGASTSWGDEGLLSADDRGSYQRRWDDIQVRFIDEPRQCVREADDLVGEVTTRISDRFTGARQHMEQRWDSGDEPTTEELRQAVQRYRDFFQRLVTQ